MEDFEYNKLTGVPRPTGEFHAENLTVGHSFNLTPALDGKTTIRIADGFEDTEYARYVTEDTPMMTIFGTPMVVPVQLKLASDSDADWWLLPTEPIMSISGDTQLIRRSVLKTPRSQQNRRGTVKERWSIGDYSIQIDGLLTVSGNDLAFPEADFAKLRRICEAREAIDVICPALERLGIYRMVIDKFSLPFTKGVENQKYSITAYSDDDFDLLLDINAL